MALTFVIVSSLLALVGAAPAGFQARDVVDPPVTSPNASTVWVVGATETVVWDTTMLPQDITNTTGIVLLGFLNDTTGNEHLMSGSPLATGFNITDGHVDIVVPNVPSGNDYIIALLGDSGNISPKFTITTTSVPTSSSSSESGSVFNPIYTTVAVSIPPTPTGTSSDSTTTTSTGLSSAVTPTSTPASSSPSNPSSFTSSSPSSVGTLAPANGAIPRSSSARLVQLVVPLLALSLIL